jgi:hypothetical protein
MYAKWCRLRGLTSIPTVHVPASGGADAGLATGDALTLAVKARRPRKMQAYILLGCGLAMEWVLYETVRRGWNTQA